MDAGKDLLSTDLQYVDCYILLMAHTLYDLYIETGRSISVANYYIYIFCDDVTANSKETTATFV